MISVRIDKSNKCKGDYSAYVSFPYDAKIVEVMRAVPSRFYFKDSKTWEIPAKKLSYLFQKLSTYEFQIVSDKYISFSERKKPKVNFKFKTKPYDYQIEGFEYGMEHDAWLLGDEMGCIGGDCTVQIKEAGKMTRKTSLANLKKLFESDNTIKIKSMVNGRFAYVPIKNVLDKGIKSTIKISLEDTDIVCTPDHLIYTKRGWVRADKLTKKDEVYTNGKIACKQCGSTRDIITYPYAKYVGCCKECMYKNRNGKVYKDADIVEKIDRDGYVRMFGKATRDMPNYKRLSNKGGVYKHHQVWYENTNHIVDTSKEVVHHINGIKTDNRFENLELMTIQEHAKLHSDTKTKHLYQFNEDLEYIHRGKTKIWLVPNLQKVTKIEENEHLRVYDVVIDDDEIHNFIANNIIVHNCGKTKQVIDIAVAKKQQEGYKHCLIICGVNGLKWNWQAEIKKHSDEHGWILGQRGNRIGGNKDKLEDLQSLNTPFFSDYYFIITNIESLRHEEILKELIGYCKDNTISMIAADEIHKMKNHASQQGKGFLQLNTPTMIAMTGTPIMNAPLDAYVPLKWLGYENHAFYSFRNFYCIMGGYNNKQVVGYKHLEVLQEQLSEVMLRRTKEDVLDLPEKTYIDEYVEMTTKQAIIYSELRQEIRANIDQIKMANNPLAELIRLRQATGYTGILSSKIKESAKLDRMEELVEEARSNGKQVVIFSNWTQITDAVYQRLHQKYTLSVITGDTKDEIRQHNVNEFQAGRSTVAIGTIGAMGTGITLTAGTVEIFLDEPWNMALKEQAVDRCHRVGQTQNITIYTLLCKGTIDERINEIVEKKGAMADALVDGKIDIDRLALLDYLIG